MDTIARRETSQVELTAKFLREIFRFENETGDVIVGEVLSSNEEYGRISVKGPCEIGELREDQSYVFFGKYSTYKNKRKNATETQFHFETFVREAPAGREAVISYLLQHGEGDGIGRARCSRLWESLGPDAVRIAREEPQTIVNTLRAVGLSVSEVQAESLSKRLTEDVGTEKTKLDLAGLLTGRGFPKTLATMCMQKWGNIASQLIRRNPFQLMAFKNCGFKKCDSMYLDLGLPPAAMKRQALCAWYSIARDTEGHTWYPWAYPDAFIRSNISGAGVNVEKALSLATRAKIMDESKSNSDSLSNFGNQRWFAESIKSNHESEIARSVVYSRSEKLLWPDVSKIANTTDHQREELAKAMNAPIGILGGSPGTGKTWTVASLVESLGQTIGFNNIAIGAPTGKAAVRVTENLSSRGLELRARTWHSLLMQLESNKLDHFPKKILIGDESSMLDTDLMARIFRARAVGCHVLLVGDVNQLPPVGHGAPLRDLIAAGVPYGDLREIHRNSGGIVEACAAIRDGRRWETGENLILDSRMNPNSQIASCLSWMSQAGDEGLNPIWDCQVVVPVNERSPLCRKEMNRALQQHLNHAPGIDGIPFRIGDKLVNTKNAFFDAAGKADQDADRNAKNQIYVANGELAKVLHIDKTSMVVELQSPLRVVEVRIIKGRKESSESKESEDTEESSGCTFELGYALSVHKSQGSDWPWVITMLDEYAGAKLICDRSFLYTAISRAKDKKILIGKRETADRWVRVSNIQKRKTFLKEKILQLSAIESLAHI